MQDGGEVVASVVEAEFGYPELQVEGVSGHALEPGDDKASTLSFH